MPTTPRLREAVLASREQLQMSRHKLRQQHDRGSHGIHLCSLWSQRLEEVSLRVFDDAILMKEHEMPRVPWRNHLTLVAHGGFGRRDTAPYSDLDVMLLYAPEIKHHVAVLAGQLLQNLSDLGEDIGFSARMPVDACQLASQDPMIRLAAAVDVPVVADADTGFGNAVNVVRTVETYARAGAAAGSAVSCGFCDPTSVMVRLSLLSLTSPCVTSTLPR